jgi:iron complex outermembrane receptor protein
MHERQGKRLTYHYRNAVVLSAATLTVAISSSAFAQTASQGSGSVLEEIVVTSAREREETVQQTPVAVTVMSERDLERFHATTLNDMSGVTPNVQIYTTGFAQDVAEVYLRGFGVTSGEPATDPAVAMYVDGIYMPSVTGSLMDTFDLERVEVLRGPQGTLLGKNSTAGAISVRTARPSGEFGGAVKLNVERFNRTEVRARLDAPLIEDVLAAKLSVMDKQGGNYIKNLTVPGKKFGGDDIRTARLGLLFTPNERVDWYVTADYSRNRSPQHGARNITTAEQFEFTPAFTYACGLYGYCDPSRTPRYTSRAGHVDDADIKNYGMASNLTYDFGPATLTSVTGYRRYHGIVNQDIDSEAETIFHAYDDRIRYRVATQEFRLASNEGQGWDLDGRLDWLVGLYGFYQKYDMDYHFRALDILAPPDGIPVDQYQKGTTKSYAGFAHVIYKFNDQWSISAGARQTKDKKDHWFRTAGEHDENADWSNFSWEAGTEYKLDDEKMVYVRYATGYRGGGFVGTPDAPEYANQYDPEKVKYVELGLKADWFDKRLRTNLVLFHAKYSDLQRAGDLPADNPQGFIQTTLNAADAKSRGVELELTAVPIPQLTLRQNIGYLDNKYDRYFGDLLGTGVVQDLSDIPFQASPKWTSYTSASYEYTVPKFGTNAAVNASYSYHTKQYIFSLPSPYARQPAIGLLDASLDFDLGSPNVQLSLYGKNLTDKKYFTYVAVITPGVFALDALPRTYGASLKVSF